MTSPAHSPLPSPGRADDPRTRAEHVEQNLNLVYAAAFSRVGNLEFARRAAHRAFVETFRRCAGGRATQEFEAVLAVVLSEQTAWTSVQLSGAVPHRPVPSDALEDSPDEEAVPAPVSDPPIRRGLARTREVRLHRALCEAFASLAPGDRATAALVFVQALPEDQVAGLLAIPAQEVQASVRRVIARIEAEVLNGGPDLPVALGVPEATGGQDDARDRMHASIVERLRLYRLGPEFVEGVLTNTLMRLVLD